MLYSTLASPGPLLQRQLAYKSWLSAPGPDCSLTSKIGHLQKTKLDSNPRCGPDSILHLLNKVQKHIKQQTLPPLYVKSKHHRLSFCKKNTQDKYCRTYDANNFYSLISNKSVINSSIYCKAQNSQMCKLQLN